MRRIAFALISVVCRASVTIPDLADLIPAAYWAADNAVVPDWGSGLGNPYPQIQGASVFTGQSVNQYQQQWNTTQNQTSVIVATGASLVQLSWSNIVKSGFGGSVSSATTRGLNSAIYIANGSTGVFSFDNITTHNGAIAMFSTDPGSNLTVSRSTLYSTGPVGHSLFSAVGGSVFADNIFQYSGGSMSSAFATGADGSTSAINSIAHTSGAGSPIFYGTGTNGYLFGQQDKGNADNSSIAVLDGSHTLSLSDCTLTGNGLGGIISTNTVNTAGALSNSTIQITNSWLATTGNAAPAFWVGNTNASIRLYYVRVQTASNVLVVANRSQLTPDYTDYGPSNSNATLTPGIAQVDISYSNLQGDLVAYLGGWITWILRTGSIWTGGTYPVDFGGSVSGVDVLIATDCQWNLAHDSQVQNFWDEDSTLSNVFGNGFSIHYNTSAPLNGWLAGRTLPLQGGGTVLPY
ncbi:hypothetical protein NKR23_g10780 [Pleurostoma richardsiae]|uniref:Uncharacterized protein n=1 Tax=Pleurostoma richardsiae TaxID=41990 RepID=A0AA38VBR9_9PEZI|nr:hypothetical protein NKR23_g10780 [Pleurostoma richardsiae]